MALVRVILVEQMSGTNLNSSAKTYKFKFSTAVTVLVSKLTKKM